MSVHPAQAWQQPVYGAAKNKGEFAKLSKPFSDAKPGKLAYSIEYKLNH